MVDNQGENTVGLNCIRNLAKELTLVAYVLENQARVGPVKPPWFHPSQLRQSGAYNGRDTGGKFQ